jgi:hypothetical protein
MLAGAKMKFFVNNMHNILTYSKNMAVECRKDGFSGTLPLKNKGGACAFPLAVGMAVPLYRRKLNGLPAALPPPPPGPCF